jgi:hypothetical protein
MLPCKLVPWVVLMMAAVGCRTSFLDYACSQEDCSTSEVQQGTDGTQGSHGTQGTDADHDSHQPPDPVSEGPNPTDPEDSTSTGAVDLEESGTSTGEQPPLEETGSEPAPMYAPCESDEECESEFCWEGFCTQICWSYVGGNTPCPPAPGDTQGVEIVCSRVVTPNPFGLCQTCGDCSLYCMASCDENSTCPGTSTCLPTGCAGDKGYCGYP